MQQVGNKPRLNITLLKFFSLQLAVLTLILKLVITWQQHKMLYTDIQICNDEPFSVQVTDSTLTFRNARSICHNSRDITGSNGVKRPLHVTQLPLQHYYCYHVSTGQFSLSEHTIWYNIHSVYNDLLLRFQFHIQCR
jgi:hypothetical protein